MFAVDFVLQLKLCMLSYNINFVEFSHLIFQLVYKNSGFCCPYDTLIFPKIRSTAVDWRLHDMDDLLHLLVIYQPYQSPQCTNICCE